MAPTSRLLVQLISCTTGCVGFAIWFQVKGKHVLYAGIGAFFTWIIYALMSGSGHNNFLSTFVGAIFVAAYAQLMARVNKAPATIFQTACVFPLVPGSNLYYTMYYLIMEKAPEAKEEALTLLITCLGISLGFIVVEIINKYTMYMLGHRPPDVHADTELPEVKPDKPASEDLPSEAC